METFQNFLNHYDKIISIVSFIFMAIFSVLLYKRTGNINYIKEVFNNMLNKENGNLQDKVVKGQTFTNLKPVYRLNKSSGKLELTDEVIDIDEVVKSSLTTTLDYILDKFLPNSMGVSDEVYENESLVDKLDVMQNAFALSEELKTKYNLDPNLSMTEVFDKVKELQVNLQKDIDTKVSTINAVKTATEKVKTEVDENA